MFRPAVLALALLLATASPARADLGAWLRESALPRLGAGLEWGTALPVDPWDFGAGWGDGRGCGGFVRCALTPTTDVLLRAERDRFRLTGDGFRGSTEWAAIEDVAGTDATMTSLLLGLRAHQARGVVRAHATLYAGKAWRTGRRVAVTYRPPTPIPPYTVSWGEPDGRSTALGFGVGATWAIPRLPDLTVEARMLWLVEGPEAMVPLRVGVTLP